jgi:hypothetical protein
MDNRVVVEGEGNNEGDEGEGGKSNNALGRMANLKQTREVK